MLTYHFMARVYTHDRLVNRTPPDRNFVVLGQDGPNDQHLFGNVDDQVARYLPDGGTLWCVIPYAMGPEEAGKACPVSPSLQQVERVVGRQAIIVGYAMPPTSGRSGSASGAGGARS